MATAHQDGLKKSCHLTWVSNEKLRFAGITAQKGLQGSEQQAEPTYPSGYTDDAIAKERIPGASAFHFHGRTMTPKVHHAKGTRVREARCHTSAGKKQKPGQHSTGTGPVLVLGRFLCKVQYPHFALSTPALVRGRFGGGGGGRSSAGHWLKRWKSTRHSLFLEIPCSRPRAKGYLCLSPCSSCVAFIPNRTVG